MPINTTKIPSLVDDLIKLKSEGERIATATKAVQEDLIAEMKSVGVSATAGDLGRATLVEPVAVVTNETKLKKAIGADLWRKATKSVLDRKLLESLVALGEVDANVVAQCSEEVARAAYVKVTMAGSKFLADHAQPNAAPRVPKGTAAKTGGKRRTQKKGM